MFEGEIVGLVAFVVAIISHGKTNYIQIILSTLIREVSRKENEFPSNWNWLISFKYLVWLIIHCDRSMPCCCIFNDIPLNLNYSSPTNDKTVELKLNEIHNFSLDSFFYTFQETELFLQFYGSGSFFT